MNESDLLNEQTYLELSEVKFPEQKILISEQLMQRAKELGMVAPVRRCLKAYNDAEQKLEREYKAANRDRSGIDLDYGADGRPLASIDNFLQVIRNDQKFAGLRWNLLTNAPEQDGRKWLDADDAETRRYIEKKYRIHSTQKCDDALRIVFRENEYHPIRDLIDAMEWDGVPRCAGFLHFATQCEDTPYTREVSRLIFAGGINRLYRPGCKFDDMAVLIGTRQGEGKSTLIRWLAMKDEWYTEIDDFDGQKGIEGMEGAWICEVGELLALTKAREQEAVKAFLTRLNDRYRMPFDRRVTDHPRQCVFLGTTNKEQFLMDKTGNRRFYPVKVKQNGYELFDRKDEIQAYIRQCWAEAKAKLGTEEMQPYANRSLTAVIRAAQSDATEDDWRVGMIDSYLEDRNEVCVLEIWRNALNMGEYSKPTKKDSNDIGLILQGKDGWEKQSKPKRFPEFGLQKWWRRSGDGGGDFGLLV